MANSIQSASSSSEPIDNETKALNFCQRANDLLSLTMRDEDPEEIASEQYEQGVRPTAVDQQQDDDMLIEQATKLFQQAMIADAASIEAHIGLSYIAGLMGDTTASGEYLDKAEKFAPADERIKTLREALLVKIENDRQHVHGPNCSHSHDSHSHHHHHHPSHDHDHVHNENCNHEDQDDLEGVLPVGKDIDVPMIIEKGSVTKKFIMVLRDIFDRFDANKDNSLNNREMQAYSRAVNGQELDDMTMDFLLGTYHSDEHGLTFTGFVELYVNQTMDDPEETFKDLRTLGYNTNLQNLAL
eukprot:gene3992-4622_t